MNDAARLFALDAEACQALARRHGTPLFAYHTPAAAGQYSALRAALPARVRLAYAVKANPHPRLLGCFAELGAAFDCASAGEMRRVVRAAGTGRGLFAGPGKRDGELALAVRWSFRVQADGWEDLRRLDALVDRETPVNLRVHPRAGVREDRAIIGGSGPSAFGVDEEDVPGLLERARGLRHVRVQGLQVFAATNQRRAERLLETWARVFNLARDLHRGGVLDCRQIDLGGGLGVPYAAGDPALDLAALGGGLAALLAGQGWFEGEVVLEPGRFLAASCGVYLARVLRVKPSRGVRFVVLEGGINHLLRPLLTGEPFPVRALGREGPLEPATLAGPLCTSLDRLGEAALPPVEPGDLLAFGMAGAYGCTEAMGRFLSHPPPREIWVER